MKQEIQTNMVKPEITFIENEKSHLVITPENETLLDSKIQEIEDYMINVTGKGESNEVKDEIYKNSQIKWQELSLILKNVKYNFHLNRKQYKFLTDLIIKNLEYDINTVFFAIELTELLGSMKADSNYSNDTDLISFSVNATELTYIYHLISTHKVKGLNSNSYYFAQILTRIGSISKMFNYYDSTAKNLAIEIQDWVSSFEDNVTLDKNNLIEGEVVDTEQEN